MWDPNFGLPQLALERDAAGATLRSTTYGLGPLSASEAGQTSYLHADRLGSIAATSTAAGDPGWSYGYDPFGAERRAEQLDPAAAASPYRFSGQLLDPTGLYHLRARQYDPGSGRFLSTDPVAAALADPYVSSYAYVRNNPLRWTDPSGRCPWCIVGAAVGALGGGIIGAASYVVSKPADSDWDWGGFALSTGAGAVGGAITGATLGLAGHVGAIGAAAGTAVWGTRAAQTILVVEGSVVGGLVETSVNAIGGNRPTATRFLTGLVISAISPLVERWAGVPLSEAFGLAADALEARQKK